MTRKLARRAARALAREIDDRRRSLQNRAAAVQRELDADPALKAAVESRAREQRLVREYDDRKARIQRRTPVVPADAHVPVHPAALAALGITPPIITAADLKRRFGDGPGPSMQEITD